MHRAYPATGLPAQHQGEPDYQKADSGQTHRREGNPGEAKKAVTIDQQGAGQLAGDARSDQAKGAQPRDDHDVAKDKGRPQKPAHELPGRSSSWAGFWGRPLSLATS